MSDSFATPWTVACQAPLSMQFPRQEYCSGLPFPFPYHKRSLVLVNMSFSLVIKADVQCMFDGPQTD